jgi:hypothetical protein
MTVLMYLASFGAVFALFLSVIAGAAWLLIGFVRAWGRFFDTLLNPPAFPVRKAEINLNLLKRAGQ